EANPASMVAKRLLGPATPWRLVTPGVPSGTKLQRRVWGLPLSPSPPLVPAGQRPGVKKRGAGVSPAPQSCALNRATYSGEVPGAKQTANFGPLRCPKPCASIEKFGLLNRLLACSGRWTWLDETTSRGDRTANIATPPRADTVRT